MDRPYTKLSLDCRDKRGPLEECAGESLQCSSKLRLSARELVVKPYDADIFFTSTLLGFDESSCAIQADDQAASDLGIQGSTMSGFFDPANR